MKLSSFVISMNTTGRKHQSPCASRSPGEATTKNICKCVLAEDPLDYTYPSLTPPTSLTYFPSTSTTSTTVNLNEIEEEALPNTLGEEALYQAVGPSTRELRGTHRETIFPTPTSPPASSYSGWEDSLLYDNPTPPKFRVG